MENFTIYLLESGISLALFFAPTLPVLFFVILAFSIPKNNAELNQLNGQNFSDINQIKETILTEQDKKKKVKQEKVALTKNNKAKELKETWLKIDQKLADKSLSDKDRQVLMNKKKSIEISLKKQQSAEGKIKPTKSTNLLSEKKAIEKKLASDKLSDKDRIQVQGSQVPCSGFKRFLTGNLER